jgi:hypothetical protein
MPTLLFAGDAHGQLLKLYAAVQDWMERTGIKIDGIVQVGDLGVFRKGTTWSTMWANATPAPIPTWAIMGNHEDPMAIAEWQKDPARIPGLHLLPDGGTTDVLGVKIASVWGNYSPISWLNPQRVEDNRVTGNSHRIAMHINHNAVDRLMTNYEHMDVLVTHDSASSTLPAQFRGSTMDPMIKSILGLTPNEESNGCQGFSMLLKVFKPDHYFFGHLHVFDEGYVGRTHYACLNALAYEGGPWWKVVQFPKETNYVDC